MARTRILPTHPIAQKREPLFHLVVPVTNDGKGRAMAANDFLGKKTKCGHVLTTKDGELVEVVAPWKHPGMCQECLFEHTSESDIAKDGTRVVMTHPEVRA